MDLFNFFPGLERSNEAYFGQDAPLSQDLITYSGKLKTLFQDANNNTLKDKKFNQELNSLLIEFGEVVALDLNVEKVTFIVKPSDDTNAGSYPIYIRSNLTTIDKQGNVFVDFNKIADFEDIIITSEGYQYRNKKNKLLCISINKGLIQKCSVESIAGVIAHELGHCFEIGIFGVYKELADITFQTIYKSKINLIKAERESLPKFIRPLTKVLGFRFWFLLYVYFRNPQYLFTTGLFAGLGAKLSKFIAGSEILDKKNKTYTIKEQIGNLDNRPKDQEKLKNELENTYPSHVIRNISKSNDRDKFIEQLKENNVEEWKVYIQNTEELKPVNSKFINFWKKLTLQIDNLDTRIINLLTLSKFTNKQYSKITFAKKWEYFSDIFAASYGFGPDLYKFVHSSTDEDLKYLDSLGMGLYWKYHLFKTFSDSATHGLYGTNKQRLQNIYTGLMYELKNNKDISNDQRRQIEQQITELKTISEQVYEIRKSEKQSFLAKAYNRLIDDRINGISHDTEEKILKPIDDICKEMIVGKSKQELKNSLESLIF